jgi:hypothetical protein
VAERRTILVQGSGVAARCCLQLLQGQGASVAGGEAKSPKLPAILISPSTQSLLADIFHSKELFAALPKIRRRVVAWGGAEPVVLPHAGVVVGEEVLLERLKQCTAVMEEREAIDPVDPLWTIFATKPGEHWPEEKRFGSRTAFVGEVELTDEAERDACWVESVDQGWLFLLSTGNGQGSLIAVGGTTEELLAGSRLTAQQVRKVNGVGTEFAAHPRIASRLCGDDWLACGTAAMTFDPLCGEGAGNAAREAILACAAVRAIVAGENTREVLDEYSLRLMLGFLRHLKNCKEFYAGDVSGAFWSSEFKLIEQGIAWAKSQLREGPRPRFRLVGFGLERVAGEESS